MSLQKEAGTQYEQAAPSGSADYSKHCKGLVLHILAEGGTIERQDAGDITDHRIPEWQHNLAMVTGLNAIIHGITRDVYQERFGEREGFDIRGKGALEPAEILSANQEAYKKSERYYKILESTFFRRQ